MNNKYILIVGILILIGGGILAYSQKKENDITIPTPSASSAPVQSPAFSSIPTLTPPPEIWETYTNSELGFSIKYPQMVYGSPYRCSPYKPFYVPIKVFEDNKNTITYITQEYYYQAPYSEELKDYTGPCEKITYSLKILQDKKGWGILIRNIKNETELNKFIKDSYGSGCFIENKTPWKQNGVYDIIIKGEDWDKFPGPGDTTCSSNYKYKILYTPEKNKIMSVNLGQECSFVINPGTELFKCYDDEMINSFKFE